MVSKDPNNNNNKNVSRPLYDSTHFISKVRRNSPQDKSFNSSTVSCDMGSRPISWHPQIPSHKVHLPCLLLFGTHHTYPSVFIKTHPRTFLHYPLVFFYKPPVWYVFQNFVPTQPKNIHQNTQPNPSRTTRHQLGTPILSNSTKV